MSPTPSHVPLRTKLAGLMTALLAGLALFLLAYGLPRHLKSMSHSWVERRATGVAKVMATAVAPGFEFDDTQRVKELLEGLSTAPEVSYAWVRREDGSELASFHPERLVEVGLHATEEPKLAYKNGQLHVVAPVQGRAGTRGTLGIGFSLGELDGQERDNLVLVASASATVFALGLAFAYLVNSIAARRRRTEEALALSETSFRTLVDRSPEPMLIHRGGRIVSVNVALIEYLGYERPDELVGTSVIDIVHPDDRAAIEERFAELLRTGRSARAREERLLRRDGQVITAEVMGVNVVVDGKPALVAIARDVTERKHLLARMMQMDRLLAVGTLAAGVAHEINNPLAYVMGNVEWLSSKVVEIEKKLQSLQTALPAKDKPGQDLAAVLKRLAQFAQVLGDTGQGAERVRLIVRDLKTLSRPDEERPTPVSVQPVIESAIHMAWNEIRHRAKLVKDYRQVPPVLANEARLGQVLLNLFINAAQAIPEGQAESNEIGIRTFAHEGRVCIEVRDTGVGIPPATVARIFDPFFTTKPVGQGTGLGLAICQSIVRSLGGEIEVESEMGEGTTFRVLLPTAPFGDSQLRPTPLPLPGGRRGRVLVVDDEPLIGSSLGRSLEEDHEVVVLTSAREALRRLDGGERFDVIFCDVMMPDITGIDFYEKLQVSFPEQAQKMIFFTGGAFTPRAQEFLSTVPNKLVDKPFDVERVRRLVRDLVK